MAALSSRIKSRLQNGLWSHVYVQLQTRSLTARQTARQSTLGVTFVAYRISVSNSLALMTVSPHR